MSSPLASTHPTRLTSLADRIKQVSVKPATVSVPLESIERNPDQPRKQFNEASLGELADSIRTHGLVQPLVVRPASRGRYQLVAGERRWRAAKIAGLENVPVIVRELSDTAALAIALVENLDREDMVPCDEVSAVAKLAASMTVQAAASALGKAPSWVSKRKRVADAPDFVAAFVREGLTSDIEALYELTKLAEHQEPIAREIIRTYIPGTHLRDRVKAAARTPETSTSPVSNSRTGGAPVSHAKVGGDAQARTAIVGSAPARRTELTPCPEKPTDRSFVNGPAGDGSVGAALSHAKTSRDSHANSGMGPDALAHEAHAISGAEKPADRPIVVIGAVRRDGIVRLLIDAANEFACTFTDGARDQLIELLMRR
jgi:ParB/RepB/Spo0J family partition protein